MKQAYLSVDLDCSLSRNVSQMSRIYHYLQVIIFGSTEDITHLCLDVSSAFVLHINWS